MANETIETIETTVLKTFTLKNIGLDADTLDALVQANAGEFVIADVSCLVTGYEKKVNKQDPTKHSYRFEGDFAIVSAVDGLEVRAAGAFLPGPAEPFLKGKLDANEGAPVAVPLTITIKKVSKTISATGYVFGMKGFLKKGDVGDVHTGMRKVFPSRKPLKALAAPEVEVSKAKK